MSVSLAEVERTWLEAFTVQSERDKQVQLGPSEVGSCYYCVGYTMASKLCEMPPRDDAFGYAAKIGTMGHYFLERELQLVQRFEDDLEARELATMREHRLDNIFEVEGYGPIGGSCDLYVPDWARTFDYKFPGDYSYNKVKLAIRKGEGPSIQYRVQQQIYAQGFIQRGYPVENCVIIFLPRHTNSVNDIVFWEEPVNQELFDRAVENTEIIWQYVLDGQLGEIPSQADCYTCDRHGRGDLTNYNQLHTI